MQNDIALAGHEGSLDAGKAMTMTVADILGQPEIPGKIKREFRHGQSRNP
jgi:hypothetical protein